MSQNLNTSKIALRLIEASFTKHCLKKESKKQIEIFVNKNLGNSHSIGCIRTDKLTWDEWILIDTPFDKDAQIEITLKIIEQKSQDEHGCEIGGSVIVKLNEDNSGGMNRVHTIDLFYIDKDMSDFSLKELGKAHFFLNIEETKEEASFEDIAPNNDSRDKINRANTIAEKKEKRTISEESRESLVNNECFVVTDEEKPIKILESVLDKGAKNRFLQENTQIYSLNKHKPSANFSSELYNRPLQTSVKNTNLVGKRILHEEAKTCMTIQANIDNLETVVNLESCEDSSDDLDEGDMDEKVGNIQKIRESIVSFADIQKLSEKLESMGKELKTQKKNLKAKKEELALSYRKFAAQKSAFLKKKKIFDQLNKIIKGTPQQIPATALKPRISFNTLKKNYSSSDLKGKETDESSGSGIEGEIEFFQNVEDPILDTARNIDLSKVEKEIMKLGKQLNIQNTDEDYRTPKKPIQTQKNLHPQTEKKHNFQSENYTPQFTFNEECQTLIESTPASKVDKTQEVVKKQKKSIWNPNWDKNMSKHKYFHTVTDSTTPANEVLVKHDSKASHKKESIKRTKIVAPSITIDLLPDEEQSNESSAIREKVHKKTDPCLNCLHTPTTEKEVRSRTPQYQMMGEANIANSFMFHQKKSGEKNFSQMADQFLQTSEPQNKNLPQENKNVKKSVLSSVETQRKTMVSCKKGIRKKSSIESDDNVVFRANSGDSETTERKSRVLQTPASKKIFKQNESMKATTPLGKETRNRPLCYTKPQFQSMNNIHFTPGTSSFSVESSGKSVVNFGKSIESLHKYRQHSNSPKNTTTASNDSSCSFKSINFLPNPINSQNVNKKAKEEMEKYYSKNNFQTYSPITSADKIIHDRNCGIRRFQVDSKKRSKSKEESMLCSISFLTPKSPLQFNSPKGTKPLKAQITKLEELSSINRQANYQNASRSLNLSSISAFQKMSEEKTNSPKIKSFEAEKEFFQKSRRKILTPNSVTSSPLQLRGSPASTHNSQFYKQYPQSAVSQDEREKKRRGTDMADLKNEKEKIMHLEKETNSQRKNLQKKVDDLRIAVKKYVSERQEVELKKRQNSIEAIEVKKMEEKLRKEKLNLLTNQIQNSPSSKMTINLASLTISEKASRKISEPIIFAQVPNFSERSQNVVGNEIVSKQIIGKFQIVEKKSPIHQKGEIEVKTFIGELDSSSQQEESKGEQSSINKSSSNNSNSNSNDDKNTSNEMKDEFLNITNVGRPSVFQSNLTKNEDNSHEQSQILQDLTEPRATQEDEWDSNIPNERKSKTTMTSQDVEKNQESDKKQSKQSKI